MVIDEKTLEKGIDPIIISKLIARREAQKQHMETLMDYYLGRHKILGRVRAGEKNSNNKLVCNHAKYIVDMANSYLVGNPVSYSCAENFDIEPLKNCYIEQDIESVDCELEKLAAIYGTSYELIYADEKSMPRSTALSPVNTFMVYGMDVGRKPLFGVHCYRRLGVDANPVGTTCLICDDRSVYIYENNADSFTNMKLVSEKAHHFGTVPMIEYANNKERQGDFEQLIPLIDAYNTLASDRVNDKEQFVDALLFLTDIDIDSEQARKLRDERVLLGYEGATAQYLSKTLSETDTAVLRDNLKQDIHRFSMVPDLSDESFGNNLSGVAIKYKLLGFEQHIRNKERCFAASLKRRYEIYNYFLWLKGSMEHVPVHRVDIIFTRNLPVNELETSEMISNLSGIATSETLLSQLSFVKDAKEESELAKRERENQQFKN